MKRLICLAMALMLCVLAFTSCGKATYDATNENFDASIELGDMTAFPYQEICEKYTAFRESMTYTSGTFYAASGYTLDFALKAEITGAAGSSAIEKWTGDFKGYDVYKKSEYANFDYAICNYVADAADSAKIGRLIEIGKEFSFTMKIASDYEDATLAGKTVKFTVTVSKALPDVYSDSYITDMLLAFYMAVSKTTARTGNNVVISFTGEVDGNAFVRNTSGSVVIGDPAVYGFEDQLVGCKEGDKLTLTATIPATYSDEALAGKKATYNVEVKSILAEIKRGDTVKFDYSATIDGEPFEGSKGENFSIIVGEGDMIPGFEDQLIGHKEAKFEITVTYPSDYENEAIAGKEAVFAIEIKDIYNDNDLIQDNTPFDNIWDLKNALRIKSFYSENMIAVLADRSKAVSYPEDLTKYLESLYTDFANDMIASEIEYQKKLGKTLTKKEARALLFLDDGYQTFVTESAKEMCFNYMVIRKAQKALDIAYTDEDYKADLAKSAEEYTQYNGMKYTAEDVEKLNGEFLTRLSFIADRVTAVLVTRISGEPNIPLQ